MKPKPAITFDASAIPEDMKQYPNWVVWRLEIDEKRPDKIDKMPYQAGKVDKDGNPIKALSNNPRTWSTWEMAIIAYNTGGWDGIGFELGNSPYGCADLDSSVGEDGTLSDTAAWVIPFFNSFTEFSQSGRGLHVFFRADKAGYKTHVQKGKELYLYGRFIAMTGKRWEGTPATIEERQGELDGLYKTWFPEEFQEEQGEKQQGTRQAAPLHLSDTELLEKMREHNPKFAPLFDQGSLLDYGNNHSHADQALVNILVWWLNGDAGRVDTLFRNSALFRAEKWGKRADYRERTIATAIRLIGNKGYNPEFYRQTMPTFTETAVPDIGNNPYSKTYKKPEKTEPEEEAKPAEMQAEPVDDSEEVLPEIARPADAPKPKTLAQWKRRGSALFAWKNTSIDKVQEYFRWEIARWYAEGDFPEGKKWATLEEMGCKHFIKTVTNWAYAFRKWEEIEDRGGMPFSHCAELAPKPQEAKREYVERYKRQKFTIQELRAELGVNDTGGRKPQWWQILKEKFGEEFCKAFAADVAVDPDIIFEAVKEAIRKAKAAPYDPNEAPREHYTGEELVEMAQRHVNNQNPDEDWLDPSDFNKGQPTEVWQADPEPMTQTPQPKPAAREKEVYHTQCDSNTQQDPESLKAEIWALLEAKKMTPDLRLLNKALGLPYGALPQGDGTPYGEFRQCSLIQFQQIYHYLLTGQRLTERPAATPAQPVPDAMPEPMDIGAVRVAVRRAFEENFILSVEMLGQILHRSISSVEEFDSLGKADLRRVLHYAETSVVLPPDVNQVRGFGRSYFGTYFALNPLVVNQGKKVSHGFTVKNAMGATLFCFDGSGKVLSDQPGIYGESVPALREAHNLDEALDAAALWCEEKFPQMESVGGLH